MFNLSSSEKYYLINCSAFSFTFSCILILYKINFRKSSVISIFFALFFLTCFFFQPFLLALDCVYANLFLYANEKRSMNIDQFLKWEYKFVCYVSSVFSILILPIHTDFLVSGYFTFREKMWDCIKRYLKKQFFLIIIGLLYTLVSLILSLLKGKHMIKKSKDFFDFLLNLLIIPRFFSTCWYLGAYFPLLIGELKMEYKSWRSDNYFKTLIGVLGFSIDKE